MGLYVGFGIRKGNVMGYRLKSGLGKRAVYQMVVDHNTSEVKLPPVGKCEFSRLKTSYWLKFDFEDMYYRLYFSSWCGEVRFSITKYGYDEEGGRDATTIESCLVPFEYLLEHEMLREVP